MLRYTGKRIVTGILSLFVLATATFFLIHFMPGSPFQSGAVSQQVVDALEKEYGLSEPLISQYFSYMGNLLRGDLGISYKKTDTTVNDIISMHFPVSARVGAVAVLVSGGGTNLQAILDAERRGELPHAEVKVVVSSRADAYALERARAAGVAAVAVERGKYASQEEFEDGIERAIKNAGAEIIVLAGFMSILSERFTSRYPERIINVHPSLIPKFCGKGFYGLKVHEAVLAAGEKTTGATVHYVNEIPDGGEIIFQKEVAVKEGDTPESLQKRVMQEAEWQLLPRAVELTAERIAAERSAK